MNVLKTPFEVSFSKNPILFAFEMNSIDDVFVFELDIYSTLPVNTSLYQGVYRILPYKSGDKYYVKFDISQDIDPFTQYLVNSEVSNGEIGFIVNRIEAGESFQFEAKAIPGGIPDKLFYELDFENTNIFEKKFKNIFSSFLLTTRKVFEQTIIIRESELSVMSFFYDDNYEYSLRCNSKKFVINPFISNHLKLCFADFKVAYDFLDPDDGLMKLCVDGGVILSINVIPDDLSEEMYILEFRNSLGFLEKILLQGEAKEVPGFSDAEYYLSNENYFLEKKSKKTKISKKIELGSGSKLVHELDFLMDALASDEVYFIDVQEKTKQKCKISSALSYPKMQNFPNSVTIQVDFLQEDENVLSYANIQERNIFLQTNDGVYITTNNNKKIAL